MNATLAALIAAQAAYEAARRKVGELPAGHPELPAAVADLGAAADRLTEARHQHYSTGGEYAN